MDTNEFVVLKLLFLGFLVNTWMMSGTSASDNFNLEPTITWKRRLCNESRLRWEVEVCGEHFKRDMAHIDPEQWCNLTYFMSEYHLFTLCTETKSHNVDCYWPNPLVESYIIRIHKHFFSNCTIEEVIWVDPPDDTLTILILIPVFLTLAMIALVVWCSKRSDLLA
ncbi:receptor activity-modifying protein 3-like [Girardinichthys multiradiatus]|uniref:receptor activity-modifying protein 3-like n=1 Tax=Girardinichthys multiradiatus TaxID=208333 RepID=UPI001FAB89FA|nr:receptor activity-modifying protein 3-like [Girardinichthys multiradiatus]XP_047206241.1 receptor activity-modifying protein 3-like [Girardinichthys multiradiatus]